jgi:hypothetical protein
MPALAGLCQRFRVRYCGPLMRFGVTSLASGLLLSLVPDGCIHALQAAGEFKGTPIDGVAQFVEKLKESLIWLGGVSIGLVVAVVALMFMAGHSRAHDTALKTLLGLMILASIGGIVA